MDSNSKKNAAIWAGGLSIIIGLALVYKLVSEQENDKVEEEWYNVPAASAIDTMAADASISVLGARANACAQGEVEGDGAAKIVGIFIGSCAGKDLRRISVASLIAGRGIEGDRYYEETGTFSEQLKGQPDKELTLIEDEEIASFNSKSGLAALPHAAFRRNIVTQGICLNDLVGKEFTIGSGNYAVRCYGMRQCEPCAYLASLLGSEVLRLMIHKCGLRARVLSSGTITNGDTVRVVPANLVGVEDLQAKEKEKLQAKEKEKQQQKEESKQIETETDMGKFSNEETPTLLSALHKAFILHGPKPCIGSRQQGQGRDQRYSWLSYDEVFHRAYIVSRGLRKLVAAPSTGTAPVVVGICCENRPEWLFSDIACCLNSYMSVGLQGSWDQNAMRYVIDKSEVQVIITTCKMLSVFTTVLQTQRTSVKHIIVMDDINFDVNITKAGGGGGKEEEHGARAYQVSSFSSMIGSDIDKREGETGFMRPLDVLTVGLLGTAKTGTCTYSDLILSEQQPYTLLYTSGTTGRPKGVAVSRRRWKKDAESSGFSSTASPGGLPTVISYMSLAHGGDRGVCWQALFAGVKIGLSLSGGAVPELMRDMHDVKPSFFLGMSHLWAEFHSAFTQELEERALAATSPSSSISSLRSLIVSSLRQKLIELQVSSPEAKSPVKSQSQLPSRHHDFHHHHRTSMIMQQQQQLPADIKFECIYKHGANLRDSPSRNARNVGEIDFGDIVVGTGRVQIDLGQEDGEVGLMYVELTSYKESATTPAQILGESGVTGWVPVVTKTGHAVVKDLATTITARVLCFKCVYEHGAHIRDTPSKNARNFGSIDFGEVVAVTGVVREEQRAGQDDSVHGPLGGAIVQKDTSIIYIELAVSISHPMGGWVPLISKAGHTVMEAHVHAQAYAQDSDSEMRAVSDSDDTSNSEEDEQEQQAEVPVPVSVLRLMYSSDEKVLKIAKQLPGWQAFVEAATSLTGIKEALLAEWVDRLGGNIFTPVTGGGHTSKETLNWMKEMFIPHASTNAKGFVSPVKNAYGASEFPGIAVNGIVNSGVELELRPLNGTSTSTASASAAANYGEIFVRNRDKSIKSEYYRDAESTQASFSADGWYKTGDIGEWITEGAAPGEGEGIKTLRIVDRVANVLELYINGDSVWVQQTRLEAEVFITSVAVDRVCLLCDRNQDSIIAVVQPSWSFVKESLDPDMLRIILELNSSDSHSPSYKQRELAFNQQSVKNAVLAALKSTGTLCGCEHYEIPRSVILDIDVWSVGNGLLTATGKPRRDALRSKHQKEMEILYARLSGAGTLAETSEMGESVKTLSAATSLQADIATTAARISSRSTMQSFFFEFPSILELNVILPSHFGDMMALIDETVGPKSVAGLGKPLGWGGYLDQFEKDLPIIPGTTRRSDFLNHFTFTGPDDNSTAELNALLTELKVETRRRIDKWAAWSEDTARRASILRANMLSTFATLDAVVKAEFSKVRTIMQELIQSTTSKILPTNLLDPLLSALAMQKYSVQRADAMFEAVTESDEKTQSFQRYNNISDRLRVLAPRKGVKIPYVIELGGWFSTADDLTNDDSAGLTTSMGSAKVVCCMSGEVIEVDYHSRGKQRWHCLDLQSIDRSMHSHQLACELLTLLHDLAMRDFKGLDVQFAKYYNSCQLNPAGLAIADLKMGSEHCQRLCTWVVETSVFNHLRDGCNLPLVDKKVVDTPAGFASRVFTQYANRLALGIPDPAYFTAMRDSRCPLMRYPKIVESANMTLQVSKNFLWITYQDLGELAMRVAKVIQTRVGKGAHVGIVGYNSIEWVVCDLACSLAGCVSVGLHTTYDVPSVHGVMSLANVALLLCTKDLLTAGSNGQFWTMDLLCRYNTNKLADDSSNRGLNLSHVCVIDEEMSALGAVTGTGTDTTPQHWEVCSLPDLLRDTIVDSTGESVVLEPLDELPVTDRTVLHTLLFTSGTSGKHKAVKISIESFMRDISNRVFVEPLSTVSYIPLSHSSDRVKVWEFLGNGGRIGFAYFSATSWLEHETIKKSTALHATVSSSNGIEPLFQQVQQMCPSSMAIPPNIASGLYYLYLQNIEADKDKYKHESKEYDPVESHARACKHVVSNFGSAIKFIATGGGPTSPTVFQFLLHAFRDANIGDGVDVTVTDSYGATEVGGICSDNVPLKIKGVQLRVVDSATGEDCTRVGQVGEAWVNSPSMSTGYYMNDAQTSATFITDEQGTVWYKTGDVVRVMNAGARKIHIMGRITSAVTLANGFTVSPDVLEGIFCASPLLQNIYIHGSTLSTALVAIVSLARDEDKDSDSDSDCENDQVHQRIVELMAKLGKDNDLRECDIPKRVHVEREPWTIENGMLNGSMKKNRAVFAAKYARYSVM